MYDQSFNLKTISRELRKSDFTYKPRLRDKVVKDYELNTALSKASGGWDVAKGLFVSQVRGKFVYRSASFSDELILRKLNRNLVENAKLRGTNRDYIVANIKEVLREGVEYRVYRLDIKSFYESICVARAIKLLDSLVLMSQPTKKHIKALLEFHAASGKTGVPRGLALSATIAEIVMQDFDNSIKELDGVFYYGRYVDDIIVVTDRLELPYRFIRLVKQALPYGLCLNTKKQMICETIGDVAPHKATSPPVQELDFEYLGYRFLVASPVRNNKKRDGQHFRDVRLDIATSKLKKIKTRIVRSLIGFNSDGDFELLRSRIKFLASNFSVMDADRDRKRLAGIFYNYHRIDSARSNGLQELDLYLTKIVSSGFGKVSDEFYSKTTLSQRRELLVISFRKGFVNKIFLHFSNSRLGKIQGCWKYV
ncbi:phage-related reverse transcriptase/maturase family protein [Pseudomonas syringae BRIP39023]|uniref:antiviral reverse transcriptase Drt3a n=1 Tax=Pseudomonas syringae TaxID=317 RepID=UPI0002A7A2D3|nr:antiviral reverse transcriptase Drt3a [Pseudomonas syringae]ELQ13669.1 phage-related reverse transcriptase/maturase family protein [Pseudomonas syringae BRIP39023]